MEKGMRGEGEGQTPAHRRERRCGESRGGAGRKEGRGEGAEGARWEKREEREEF
jgi:hypothetical protein